MALVVSQHETDLLRSVTGPLDFDCLLTLVFSAKESFFKAAFAQVRAYFDFDALQLTAFDTARRVITFRCAVTLSARLQAGYICQAHFDFLDQGSVFTAVVLRHDVSAAVSTAFPS